MYDLYQLLTKTPEGLEGPFSPVTAAKRVLTQMGVPMNSLIRILWDDPRMCNYKDGAEGYTANDTLCSVTSYKNKYQLMFFVDEGHLIKLPFLCFYDKETGEIDITVRKDQLRTFTRKPSKKIIEKIVRVIVSDDEYLKPKEGKPGIKMKG